MIARIILTLSLLCVLSGQNNHEPLVRPLAIAVADTFNFNTTVVDTISAEELFLKEISDKALAKDERRKEITNDLLIIAVVYLLVDKFFIK